MTGGPKYWEFSDFQPRNCHLAATKYTSKNHPRKSIGRSKTENETSLVPVSSIPVIQNYITGLCWILTEDSIFFYIYTVHVLKCFLFFLHIRTTVLSDGCIVLDLNCIFSGSDGGRKKDYCIAPRWQLCPVLCVKSAWRFMFLFRHDDVIDLEIVEVN